MKFYLGDIMENLQVLTNEVKMTTKEELYALLVSDLRNELTHLHFYLQSAALVQGLHSKEYKEHFLEESSKELKHVSQFSDLLIGLGLEITNMPYYEKLPKYTDIENNDTPPLYENIAATN